MSYGNVIDPEVNQSTVNHQTLYCTSQLLNLHAITTCLYNKARPSTVCTYIYVQATRKTLIIASVSVVYLHNAMHASIPYGGDERKRCMVCVRDKRMQIARQAFMQVVRSLRS